MQSDFFAIKNYYTHFFHCVQIRIFQPQFSGYKSFHIPYFFIRFLTSKISLVDTIPARIYLHVCQKLPLTQTIIGSLGGMDSAYCPFRPFYKNPKTSRKGACQDRWPSGFQNAFATSSGIIFDISWKGLIRRDFFLEIYLFYYASTGLLYMYKI